MAMELPDTDRLDKIIDALSYPDEYGINQDMLVKIQKEIDAFNKQTLDDNTVGKLLLAQALVHYQNNKDAEALDFANASISHGINYQIAFDLLNTLGNPNPTQQSSTSTVYEDPIGGPFKYIVNCYANYFNFRGRARRAEYNYFNLYFILTTFFIAFFDGMIGTVSNEPSGYGLFATIFWLINLPPFLALVSRRLHDTDINGWWTLLSLVPLFSIVIGIICVFNPSNSDTNRYGPNPKYYIE